MAFELYRWTFPGVAGSAIGAGYPVGFPSSYAGAQCVVIPMATSGWEPFGVALATANYAAATPPFSAAVPIVDRGNTIKVIAGASLGAGADIGVATTTLGVWAGPVSKADASTVWRVGKAVSPAAAGEVFGLYVDPARLTSL